MGAGSWGTAFSVVLGDAAPSTSVTLWGRRPELCAAVQSRRENPDYLPGVRLPDALTATSDPARALDGAAVVVLAVPSQTLRAGLGQWAPHVPADAVLVSLMKGLERGTARRMSEVVREVTGAGPERVAVVSGPNLAGEIAERQPAASVVACADAGAALRLQALTQTPWFRPYTTPDVVGVELCGVVKNVIALACGMAKGLGYGDNTAASLVTRGLAETTRLGLAVGALAPTFPGLAGLGDLVATCASPRSRNRTFGEQLGRGRSVAEVAGATRQVAEGVTSCESVLQLARAHGVDMPIVEAVAAVVRGEATAGEATGMLMGRAATAEHAHD
ncbi:NAD(P)-dependent glycerol-3-phosphate dehydrogenase [Vallicoccus soli]|uniref:Glycerol-3-phosphate dehydrogenase [NAD(P)+] n=2 Tax=Vallicoccus soli TaxID=2339232 RepID=A0A3A3Z2H1_9ACTN|nr:NAD(P)-dependent glycerol-3-phosphate dehydrogenase [Vallicoccus soli]